MFWDALEASDEKTVLAQTLLKTTTRVGWRRKALEQAAEEAFGDPGRWRAIFPGGEREALWFISEVSDASMRRTFQTPAHSMADVIHLRLEQNADLKPFVRKVMRYDALHPWQAVSRMQRTAQVMTLCTEAKARQAGPIALAVLNAAYTAIVFVWLLDRSEGNGFTKQLTRRVMSRLGL